MDGDGLLGILRAMNKANQSTPPDDSVGTCLFVIVLGVMIAIAVIAVIMCYQPLPSKGGGRR